MVGVSSYITSLRTIDLQYLINAKGITPWHVLFALVHSQEKETLKAISQGETQLQIPSKSLDGFMEHVGWPVALRTKHQLHIKGYHVFVLPFLMHFNHDNIKPLQQSLKAPDGSLEIFDAGEFFPNDPERFLKKTAGLIRWVKSQMS